MNVQEIRELFTYTEWANARILECARGLSEEQFTREIASSYPSIRGTLAHIVMAEWVWLRRWKGESPTAWPEWADLSSFDNVVEHLRAIEDERRELLDGLSEEVLQGELAYRSIKGDPFTTRLVHQMQHVANHSTYHRGQLTTMIRQVGAVPPATDMIVWFRNRQ
jgi:uncharacterized damage-inducible protein DinB